MTKKQVLQDAEIGEICKHATSDNGQAHQHDVFCASYVGKKSSILKRNIHTHSQGGDLPHAGIR